jgi:hypothetical protein
MRATKDSDILEAEPLTPELKDQMLAFGGKNTELHRRHNLYLDRLPHDRLVSRFRAAMKGFEMDARAEALPRYIGNLHRVERDLLGVERPLLARSPSALALHPLSAVNLTFAGGIEPDVAANLDLTSSLVMADDQAI